MVSRRKSHINFDVLRFFWDSHPGFAGAVIPIPAEVKKAADMLNGTKTSLRKAVAIIKAVTSGRVFVRDGWIGLEIRDTENRRHCFRVIRFR